MTLTYRPRARSAVAALGALVWGFFFFGLIDLLVRFVPGDDFYDTYLLETGWGVLYFILVTVPLLSVAFVPAITSPVTQVALAGCAVAVAAVLTTTWLQLWPAGGLLMVAGLLFVLGGRSTDRPSVAEPHPTSLATRVDIPTLLLTVAAAVPLIWFAAEMVASARAGRYPNDDITVGLNHWPMQAALPLTMLADRRPDRRSAVWVAGIGMDGRGRDGVDGRVLGRLSAPRRELRTAGRSGAILWSALFAAATLRSSRQAHPREE